MYINTFCYIRIYVCVKLHKKMDLVPPAISETSIIKFNGAYLCD